MSSALSVAERANPRSLPQPTTTACVVLTGLGIVAFVAGLMLDPQKAWLAFHSNFIFTTMLAAAGLVLSAIYTIVGATWCGPYRRFAESLAAWLPIAFVLSLVGILGGDELFEWFHHPLPAKAAWLNPTRVYTTDIAILGVMTVLAYVFLKASVRPTLRNLAEREREFARFYAQAAALRDRIGPINDGRRAELEAEYWAYHARKRAALDLRASGRLDRSTLEMLWALPGPMGASVCPDIGGGPETLERSMAALQGTPLKLNGVGQTTDTGAIRSAICAALSDMRSPE